MRFLLFAFLMSALFTLLTRADAQPSPSVTLAQGLKFPEGPVLSPDGKTLYTVNVQTDFISRLDLKTKTLTREWVTLPTGGRGNGATWGPDGALYVADVGRKLIARVSLPDGKVTTFVDKTADGTPFRGPNDLVFDKKGGLYFTDPDGTWDKPIASVYYVAPTTHAVSQVAAGLQFPNGLALSADERTLYVGESPLHRITAIDLTPNGIVPPGRQASLRRGCHHRRPRWNAARPRRFSLCGYLRGRGDRQTLAPGEDRPPLPGCCRQKLHEFMFRA